MSKTIKLVAFALSLCTVLGYGSEESAPPDLTKPFALLNSEDSQVREASTRQLISLGRPAMQEANRRLEGEKSPEVCARLKEIVSAVQMELRPKALTLSATVTPKSAAAGQKLMLEIRLKNIESFPVAFAHLNSRFSHIEATRVRGNEKSQITHSGVQFFNSGEIHVDADCFHVLKPGEEESILSCEIVEPEKPEPQKGPTALKKLPEGTHTINVSFSSIIYHGIGLNGDITPIQFSAEAESMCRMAWTGKLETSVSFEIKEK